MSKGNTLHLVLKGKWYRMIEAREKWEEYRELKPYWEKRLNGKSYDRVTFRLGYARNAPTMTFVIEGITIDYPQPMWCEDGDAGTDVYVIKLGRRIYEGPLHEAAPMLG